MAHDHTDHQHHHDHAHTDAGEMTFPEKLNKLVTHWIKHNTDHAETYRQWAAKARDEHMEAAADTMESVADASEKINATLETVLKQIGK